MGATHSNRPLESTTPARPLARFRAGSAGAWAVAAAVLSAAVFAVPPASAAPSVGGGDVRAATSDSPGTVSELGPERDGRGASSATAEAPGGSPASVSAARTPARPTIVMTRVRSGITGGLDSQFTVSITFSEAVTGFDANSLTLTNATESGFATISPDRRFSVTITPTPGIEDFVTVLIAEDAVTSVSTSEGNFAQTLRFRVDTRAPVLSRAYVDGDRLSVLFDEELDDGQVPDTTDFLVNIVGAASERPMAVAIDRYELVLTLKARVRETDVLSLSYTRGTTLIQDATANAAVAFTQPVVNRTGPATAPGAPTGLTATSTGTTTIDLAWQAPGDEGSSPVTGYRIEASEDAGATWADLVANTGSTATTYQHAGLAARVTRHYRVSAINDTGTGTPSEVAQATTASGPPGAPTNLSAAPSGLNGRTEIILTWTAPADDGGRPITGYRVEAQLQGLPSWVVLSENTGSTATTYADTGLTPGTTRAYRVAAISSVGFGAYSNVARGTTDAAPPGPPGSPWARALGSTSISVSWNPPADDGGAPVTSYQVEGRRDSGAWTILVGNTGSTTTTWLHDDLDPVTTWRYRISAINAAGVGTASAEASATTDSDVPGAPRGLSARAVGPTQIDLSWSPPDDDGGSRITGYQIEMSSNSGATWVVLVANTGSTATAYSHQDLPPASSRYYRVSAINDNGPGPASNVAGATTDPEAPGPPRYPTARGNGTSQKIDLAWTAPAYDGGAPVTGYRIEVSETGAEWADLVANTRAAATSYAHTGLEPGSVRFYRVSAINSAGAGQPSGVASATTDDPVQRAGRLNSSVLPQATATMVSSTLSAIAGRVDAVAAGRGMDRRVSTGGLSSMAALAARGSGRPRAGGGALGGDPLDDAARLLGETSFVLPLGGGGAGRGGDAGDGGSALGGAAVGGVAAGGLAAGEGSPGGGAQLAQGISIATWGAGEYSGLSQSGTGELDWSGDVGSVHIGADARLASDVIAGIAASRSSGAFDFTDNTGATPVDGAYGVAMTSFTPYAAWFPGGRGNAVWAAAGLGFGEVEVEDERMELRTAPTSMTTGAAGAAYQLLRSGVGGLRIKAEGWVGRVSVDATSEMDDASLSLQRGRLAMEWTQGYRSPAGQEIALVLEGGGRFDGGDGLTGSGVEVGGGLRFASAGGGITAEGRGRVLLAASDGYEEWGVGGVLRIDPRGRSQGLSVRLAPSYGDAASGVDGLWERGAETWSGVAGAGATVPRGTLDGEVAWGRGAGAGAPYAGFRLGQGGGSAFSSGVQYSLGAGMGVRVEATRREGLPGGATHRLGVRGRLRF